MSVLELRDLSVTYRATPARRASGAGGRGVAVPAVRGVDLVGTPIASFERILATGDDAKVFNGFCGAESGWVPVSAIAPSLLISDLEVERKAKGHERAPLLAPPPLSDAKATKGGAK